MITNSARECSKRFAFTVDFEDFSFNAIREVGGSPWLNEQALWLAHDECLEFMKLLGKPYTIFVSGVITKACPDIVRSFVNVGMDVGSHYHFHDDFNKESPSTARTQISTIFETAEDLIGSAPRGFRAPRFSLTGQDLEHLDILTQFFKYDSSLVLSLGDTSELPNQPLELLPLFIDRSGLVPMGTGGTYLKINSPRAVSDFMGEIARNHFLPIVYCHPYEFRCGGKFRITIPEVAKTWCDLRMAARGFRVLLRQNQWITPGMSNVLYKHLEYYLDHGWEPVGTLRSYIESKSCTISTREGTS